MMNPALALAAHPEPTALAFPAIGDLVLVARCDSVVQWDAWVERGPEVAKQELIGLVRVAALLGSRVLLTHAHVLDGIILLEMGPYELARELGVGPADLPIKVSAFDGSLRGALALMRADAGFFWSSKEAFVDRIAAAQQQDAAAREAAPGDELRSVAKTRICQQPATVEDIDRHLLGLRERWIEFLEANPHLMLVSPSRPVDARAYLGRPPEVSDGLAALTRQLSTAQKRSEAWRALIAARQAGRGSEEELDALMLWMLEGHATATAVQHDASWIAATPAGPRPRVGLRGAWQRWRRPSRPDALRLSERSFNELRDAPPGLFALFRYQVSQLYREGYRVVADPELLRISYVITIGVQVPDRRTYLRTLWRSLIWLGGVAFAAAAVTALSLNMTGVLLVAMVVLALLQTLPFEQIKARWDLLRSESGMIVNLTAHGAAQEPRAASAVESTPDGENGDRPMTDDLAQHRSDADRQAVFSVESPVSLELWKQTVSHGRRQWEQWGLTANGARPGAVVIARCGQRIAFVRQWRPTVCAMLWELPRGFGPSGSERSEPETAAQTALRELCEETGYMGRDARELALIYPDSGLLDAVVAVVEVTVPSLDDGLPGPAGASDGEVDSLAWWTEAQIDEHIAAGDVRDGITLAALRIAAS